METNNHPVVFHEEWLAARNDLLQKEKDFTRLRDELNEQRRALPWEKPDWVQIPHIAGFKEPQDISADLRG